MNYTRKQKTQNPEEYFEKKKKNHQRLIPYSTKNLTHYQKLDLNSIIISNKKQPVIYNL